MWKDTPKMNQKTGCDREDAFSPDDGKSLRDQFAKAGQEQVFRFWDELDADGRARLLSQAREIDLREIEELVEIHLGAESAPAEDFSDLEPAQVLPWKTNADGEALRAEAREIGEFALRDGRVAAFTVAGGQGTRLGYDGPKGTLRVGPVSGNSLFGVFADKLHFARARHGASIPWLILTSRANHKATEAFFVENGFFGFSPEDVFFLQQGRMPAVDLDGKIMLEAKDAVAMSPDGHGGSLRALCRSGAVRVLEERGIDVISYFQVDNPLVRAIDPVFIGHHLRNESTMSSKMIPKNDPKEKVGVFCVQNGKTRVVEYSDLPDRMANQRNADGALRFNAGSIAIHLLGTGFVRSVGEGGLRLPFHRADKKVNTVNEKGEPVKPDQPNGVKFEMFVFDALPFADNPLVMETRREEEFSPVKNAEGTDSPETCRRDQLRRAARWVKAAGIEVKTDDQGVPEMEFEISERFAADAETFVEAWQALPNKPALRPGLIIGD